MHAIESVATKILVNGTMVSLVTKAHLDQLENNLYDNDNDLGKKDLYDQITEYNKDVVSGRELHDKFLTACFYPDIYDDLELIEFDEADS